MNLEQEPKEKHYWDWKKKEWKTYTNKEKKLECSFCGYKFKKEEWFQKPTKTKEEEYEILKEEANKKQKSGKTPHKKDK
jgi:hypothetical protein